MQLYISKNYKANNMEYNTVNTILETPEEVSELLITLTGIDIYKQTRKTEYVEHRALLCHILRNKLDMRWVSISDFIKSKGKSFDHATAIHANKMYPIYYQQTVLIHSRCTVYYFVFTIVLFPFKRL